MAQSNGTSSKSKELLNKANRIIGTKTLYSILFLLTVLIVILISKNIYFSNVEEYKDHVYQKVHKNVVEKFDVMLHEKINTSILVSSSLSKNTNIKKAFLSNNASDLDMSALLDEMKTSKEYVDIQAELIDSDGISFKRSWTHLAGDDLVKNDLDMAHLIKYPRVSTDIKATKYGMTITNKVPIYDKGEFLGLFGVNIHFDALVDIFTKEDYNIVIILNKEDSKNIVQDLSYSKKFVGDCYVVNSNADDYLVKIIKTNLMEYCDSPWEKGYMINEPTDQIVSDYVIRNAKGEEIAKAFIFKSIEQIDFEDLELMKKAHIVATVILIVLLGFFLSYLYFLRKVKELKFENEELIHVNDDLKTKTDEMDFNDKKLDNLFNMQPNLMFMHNGREVTKVNKRFMGFFNRFGTFEGFKKKHKCVSELFEKYEAPNYVWEQRMENEFWVDYMLKNPRRLYKTVMSINGDPHHFIIKFNEMEYAQHVTERVIIIALVDMTQDLVNYKTLDESSKVLDLLGNKLELKEEKGNTDFSYELQEEISGTLFNLTEKEVLRKEISRSGTQSLKGQNIIKVQGTLKFADVESDWIFFVPASSASKILNIMMGSPDEAVDGNITKDNLDTSREFVSLVSTLLCKDINKKGFHDLKDARYTESTVHEVQRSDIEQLTNLFRVKVELEDNLKIDFFITLLDDIAPFLQQVVNEQEIKLPVKNKNMASRQKQPEEPKSAIDEKTLPGKGKDRGSKDGKSEQDKIDEILANLGGSDKKDEPKKEELKKEKSEQDKIDEIMANLQKGDKKEEKPKDAKANIKVREKDPLVKMAQEDIEEKIKQNDEEKKKGQLRAETELKEDNKEEAKVPKSMPVKVTPKMVKKVQQAAPKQEQKPNRSNKIDANSLIQNNFSETLKSMIKDDITLKKFSLVSKDELEGKSFIRSNNRFVIKSQEKELKWSMLMSAQSLSKIFNLMINDHQGRVLEQIDEELSNLAKDIIKKLSLNVSKNTQNKIELITSNLMKIEKMRSEKELKVYNIGMVVKGEDLPVYIFI